MSAVGLGFAAYIQPPQHSTAAWLNDDNAAPGAERTPRPDAGVQTLSLPVPTSPDAAGTPGPEIEGGPEIENRVEAGRPEAQRLALISEAPAVGRAEHPAPASPPHAIALLEKTLENEFGADVRRAELALETELIEEAALEDALDWDEHVVVSGDNLSVIFSRLEIYSQLHAILALGEEAADLERLYPGERLRAGKRDGEFETLIYEPRGDHYLEITRADADGEFIVSREQYALESRRQSVHAEIQRSLFLDGAAAGLADATLIQIADIFGWDIDFAWDIREGDRLTVIYERIYKDGEYLRDGPVLAAEFQNRGRTLRALRFAPDGEKADYFNPKGESMRQAFIRTPVDVGRISSNFGPRKHPVLGYNRQHQGVDYAAPTGTPIRAAGNGRITHRGTRGGYGNTVIIDHGNNYKTLYAHMNGYRRGHSVGSRVSQGEIIGYIGMTGLATGPHLHYEFHVRNKPVNPVTVDLPRAESLSAEHMKAFQVATAPWLAAIETVQQETQLAEGRPGTDVR